MQALRSHNQIDNALARYPLIHQVFNLCAERDTLVYLVGGTVRDLLIGQETHDLDFVVQGNGLDLARHVADQLGGYFVTLDHTRRTGRVLLSRPSRPASTTGESRPAPAPHYLDIASMRGDNLRLDLEGRDFTLNAIARDNRPWKCA